MPRFIPGEHDSAATNGAKLGECAGETAGLAAFWQVVSWVYTYTRGDGQGLPRDAHYPGMTLVLRLYWHRDDDNDSDRLADCA